MNAHVSFFSVSSGLSVYSASPMALLPVCLLIAGLFSFMPYLTRKSELFGISIPVSESGSSVLSAMRRQYRNWGLGIGAVICLLLFGIAGTESGNILSTFIVILQFVLYFALYLVFYRRMKAYKAAQNWNERITSTIAVDLSPSSHQFISPVWMLLYPLIIAITAVLGYYWYPGAPERMAHSWDFSGNVLAWFDKSYGVLWLVILMQIFMSLLMCGVFYLTKNARRQLDPDNMEESSRQSGIFRRSWGCFMIATGVLMNLTFMLALASMFAVISIKTTIVLLVLFMALIFCAAIWLTVKVGQGGSRVKIRKESGGCISVRDDDRYWKLGTIYYNPDDSAVFVEKRFGIGWTCNFARPASWLCLIGLLTFIGICIWASQALT